MRRSDREITNKDDILKFLNNAKFCNISFNTPEGYPYIFPLSYGTEMNGNRLKRSFNWAQDGNKVDRVKLAYKIVL